MDMAIRQLATDHPEHKRVVSLTSVLSPPAAAMGGGVIQQVRIGAAGQPGEAQVPKMREPRRGERGSLTRRPRGGSGGDRGSAV